MIPKLSIIIPTYKRYSELDDCLHSILVQEGNYELIVISDGFDKKTDKIISDIKSYHKHRSKQIKYLKQKNQGPATARNTGITHAGGELITFLDDDCVVCKDWIKNIIYAHKNNSKILAIAGSVLPYDHFILSQFSYSLESDFGPKNHTYFNSILINNVSYKKQVFKTIRFNDSFKHTAGEDVEFNYRLYKKGIKTLFIENICIKHRYKNTLRSFLYQQFTFGSGRLKLMQIANDYPNDKSNKFIYIIKRLATPLFDPLLRLKFAIKFKKKNALLYLPIGYLQQGAYWLGFICAFFKALSK